MNGPAHSILPPNRLAAAGFATPPVVDAAVATRLIAGARACALAAMATANLVLIGWVFDVAILTSVLPGFVSMKVNTAICFLLAGLALSLQCTGGNGGEPRKAWHRSISIGCALIVAVLGSLTLSEYLFQVNLGIDELLMLDSDTLLTTSPGRMSPVTALNFILMGLALAGLDVATRRGRRPAQWAAVLVLFICLLSLLGYAYGVESLYRVKQSTPMALHTSILFFLLGLGVLAARPDQGWLAIYTSRYPGSVQVRRLLPVLVGFPFILGWLRLAGQHAGYFDTEFGVALLIGSVIVILVALAWPTASRLNAASAQQEASMATVRESESRYRQLVHALPVAVYTCDARGRIDLYNAAAAAMWGREPNSGVELGCGSCRLYGIDGCPIPKNECPMAVTLREGRSMHGCELVYERTDGSRFYVIPHPHPIRDATGTVIGAVNMLLDITERKQAENEIRMLNATLEQRITERTTQLQAALEELEAFSHSVSHDLRAPLRALDGFSKILVDKHAPALPAEAREYLQLIREASQRMGQLISDLLEFSRLSRQPLHKQIVSPDVLVQDCRKLLQNEIADRKVEFVIGDLPACEGDPGLLKIVWLNLLSNALKYTRRRPAPRIEIGCRQNGAPVYFIRDNGIGFNMTYAGKLFGVFQRLHRAEEYEGTGVGLATARRIVQRHGGRIWAESELNKGATFYFTLEPETSHA